ncbi:MULTISPECIES: methyl-accepting chemotaxis protein [Myxococcaceae]|uniref:methyl-accepting chemotaxis protein n=1 Tax=Myxococcaceae TaxID=31 RepID=UPI00188EAE50|nr:hypothetical protein [Simulacricoccus sp. 17bor-14]
MAESDPLLAPAQGLDAYHASLQRRWVPRAQLIGRLALAASPFFLLMDAVGRQVAGESVSWGRLALLRLPWALLPLLGLVAMALPAARQRVAALAVPLSLGYCLGNDWVFYRLGEALGTRHLVVLLVTFIAPLSLLPLRGRDRWLLCGLFGAGHLAVELTTADGRPLAVKLWGAFLLLLGSGVLAVLLNGVFRQHRRMFLLRQEMQSTLGALKASRGQVSQAVTTLAASVLQLTEGAAELSQGSAESRSASEQMAAATEQMARAARALQERSRGGASTAAGASAHALAVQQLLAGVEEGVREIDQAVARSEASFRKLQAHAERIGRFVDGVQEMAAQTQMLAVNAGIEASRSGAQGAGFAVIAAEVRQLAQASAASSRDVGTVVLELQRQMDGTVASVDAVRERTGRFLAIYGQTRDTLQDVQRSVSETEGAMRENAQDAAVQAGATEAISQNTLQLLQRMEAQALLAGQVTRTSQQLGELAAGLRALLPEQS